MLALSSAEAETYGMVACSAELLGIQACAADLGLLYDASVYADASAALGIVQRRGIGKVRHLRTQSLWLQEAHAHRRLGFEKIDGSRNPSDLMTKHLSDTLQQRHLEQMSAEATAGRASTAPTLNSFEVGHTKYLYGIVGNEAPRSALRKVECGIENFLDIGSDAASGSEGAKLMRRWRSVHYSPTVCVVHITPYSELFGCHPREFDFDAKGRMIKRDVASQPGPHAREVLIGRKPDCNNNVGNIDRVDRSIANSSNIHLAPFGLRSMEEECEVSQCRSASTVAHDQTESTEVRDRQMMTHARTTAWAQVPTRPGSARFLLCDSDR